MMSKEQASFLYKPSDERFENIQSLYMHFLTKGLNFVDYLGDADDTHDINRAVSILRNGHPLNPDEKILGMIINGAVNGFIFNPFNQNTIDAVIAIKSLGGVNRRSLFSCVTDLKTVNKLIQNHPIDIDLEKITGGCFIKLEVDEKNKVPKEIKNQQYGISIMQFFILKPEGYFYNLFQLATKEWELPILGGTSANFTSYESITDPFRSAQFNLGNLIFHLHDRNAYTQENKGSFTIVSYISNQLILERSGNLDFSIVQKKLGLK